VINDLHASPEMLEKIALISKAKVIDFERKNSLK